MPYKTLSELPPPVKDNLPTHAEEIYMAAYNSAWEQHGKENNAEIICNSIAWAAVKKAYKKNTEGKWVAKEAVHPHGEHICVCSKCGKEITVQEDVRCNTQECPECGAPMVAKEAGEKRTKEAIMPNKLSDENKRQLIQQGLTTEYGLGVDDTIPRGVWVEDVFESEVIYNVNGQSYKVSYKLGEDGKTTFGEPEKVARQTIYKPLESLRTTYSEIIQEAGRRNANLDSARIKKIVALCQELLSSEEPEEKETKEALKEAKSVLTLIKEQAVMKTEDGMKFPAAAYAYIGDPEKSTTWKLRLWEDPTKKVTRAQLGRAAAALSPGGFRGQKVAIPSADLPAVKRKIRAEYRKLDVEDEEIPRWVREVETREEVLDYIPLTEVTFDKGRATVIIIKAGFNATKDRYYPKEVLQRDYGIFEGLKMYADHPTESEEKERPERSIREWVATLKDVTCDESGTVAGVAEIIEPWLMQKLAALRDKQMLSEMGISINAVGSASKTTIDGVETLSIEKLERANSVDFVTEPGAGGVVTLYESDRQRNVDLVELATLKERRPDLVKLIETNVRAEITKEVKKHMDDQERITELEGQIETLTTERDNLKEAAEKAEKEKAQAEAQALIKEAVDKAELPDAAKERLIERFKDAESAEGIEEAIKAEADYIAKLSEAGKVKNLGGSTPNPEKDKEALKESFKRMNPEWTDAQLETAVSGR